MSTDSTGPALATDHLSRSVQSMRDSVRARPRRGGWREAFVPEAAAHAIGLAIVALLEALLRLMQEFAAGQGRGNDVAARCAPCPRRA